MRITRERRQVITVEFGLWEAEAVARLLALIPCDPKTVVAQLRDRLEYHVAEAKKGSD